MTPTGATDRSNRAAGARARVWQALQAAVDQPMPSNAALAAAAQCTPTAVNDALRHFRDQGLFVVESDARSRRGHFVGGGKLLPAPIGRTTDRSRERRAVQAESSVSPRGLTRGCGHEIRDAQGRLLWRQGDDPETWTDLASRRRASPMTMSLSPSSRPEATCRAITGSTRAGRLACLTPSIALRSLRKRGGPDP